MSEEPTSPPPDPAVLNRQPNWYMPIIKGAILTSVLFLVFFLIPMVTRSKGPHPFKGSVSNAGQLWYALIGFDEEYGSFPNEKTASLVQQDFPTDIDLSGSSSNALFRQLFVSGQIDGEELFYAKIPGIRKPDSNTSPGHLLEKGEVAFAYISGLSTNDDPTSPLLLIPLIPGTTKFDPEPFDGKAVVLRIDKTVGVYDIQKDGHIYDKGINLLSPKHPVWNGKTPDIRYPDL